MQFNELKLILYIFFVLSTFNSSIFTTKVEAQNVSSQIFFDAVSFASTNSQDDFFCDIYIAIPYSTLDFSRFDGKFATNYSLKITIKKDDKIVYDSSFTRIISTYKYNLTNGTSPKFDFYQNRILLPMSNTNYIAELVVKPLINNETFSIKKIVAFKSIDNLNFALSGLLLLSKVREDISGFAITPLISEDVTNLSEGFFIFFEVYNKSNKKEFKFNVTFKNDKGVSLSNPIWFVKKANDGTTQQWIKLQTSDLPKGFYNLELKAFNTEDSTKPIAISNRSIKISRSENFPITEIELKETLDKMRYVAYQEDIDRINSGINISEKLKKLTEFWKNLDPTPNTITNEAMDEYFKRVNISSKKYSTFRDGWNTDRGRVLILYGEPDVANNDPFRRDGKAVEVWQYNFLNKTFTFVDDNGFGDYRLITLLSQSEKFRYSN